MPVFRINGRNVLFIHIPKTGGTTVERVLSSFGPMGLHGRGEKILQPYPRLPIAGHLPLQHFHGALLEAMFDRSFFDYAFMVVRDPLERLKSEYRHSQRIGRIDTRLGFSAWTRLELALARLDPCRRSNHYRKQVDFACLGATVLRFEDGLDNALRTVCAALQVAPPAAIPHERKSDAATFAVPAECLARVKRFYAEDYAAYGYA